MARRDVMIYGEPVLRKKARPVRDLEDDLHSLFEDMIVTMIEEVGFEVLADEVLTLVLDAPLDPRSRAFAHQQLDRTVAQLAGHADPEDLHVIGALVDGPIEPRSCSSWRWW